VTSEASASVMQRTSNSTTHPRERQIVVSESALVAFIEFPEPFPHLFLPYIG
jgi:hypothetical protein